MGSSQDGFDAKKMRREIFEARNTNIWMVLEFIAELARVLTQKGRQHDFVYIADRLFGLLQGNVRFKNLMFCKIVSECDVECEGMLKYYFEFEKLLSNCVGKIDILIKIGVRYFNTACYGEAIEYLLKADNIADELKDKAKKYMCCVNVGHAYLGLADYDKATEYYNKALVISTAIRDRSGIAASNGGLGNVYRILGHYGQAIEYLKKGLRISTELKKQSGIATCCENLGIVYSSMGQYKTAIEYFDEGLAISSKIGDRLGIASNNGNLGIVYMKMRQYEKAIDFYNKAIEYLKEGLRISTELKDQSGIATSWRNLGNICGKLGGAHLDMGQYAKAVEHYNEALANNTEIGDRSAVASNNNNLGNAYIMLRQYEKAIEYLNRALEINSEIGNCKGRACNYDNLGDAYHQLGQFEKAVAYLNKCLAISSEIPDQPRIANGNRLLGRVYYDRKQHEKAMECYKKSLKISTEIGDPLGIASCCAYIGMVYLSSGEFEKAIDCLNKCLAFNSEIGNQSAITSCYGNLGVAYLRMGDYEKAITFLQKCFELSVETGDPLSKSASLANMGRYHFLLSRQIPCESDAMSKLQHAVSLKQRSVQLYNKIVSDLSVDENKISFSTEYFGQYVTLMQFFILLKRTTAALLVIDLGKAKALLAFMDKRKKLDISDHMAYYVHEIWRKIDHSEEDMQVDDFRKAIQLKENNSTILFYSFDHGKILNIWILNGDGRVRHEMFGLSQDLNLPEDYIFCKLEMFLKAHCAELSRDSSMYKLDSDSSFKAQLKITEIRWSQVSFNDKFVDAKEKSGVSDLENSKNMHLQKSHSCNSIFPHNIPKNCELKMEKLVEVVQRYDLAIDVAKLRSPVKQSSVNCSNTTETGAILQALFQALIHPVKKFIKGTKLIIVPDKFLFFAPFCALLDENSCPMSEHYSIQITPSLQTLYSRMKEPHDASLGFALFVGNPKLGEVRVCGERLCELPNATEEAQLLASRFDAKPLVEGEAVKQRVLKFIPCASIIHIAAHGDRERGEIFLAPNPSSSLPKEESYLLKEKDILNIKINAKLVVLCCCHTGSGQTCSEGVVGLARAFLAAGARSVLATLWRIHDAGTKVFMEKFYDEICTETPVCEALRRAMNMLRRHENHLYRDVQIWAPFTIYGEDVKFSRQDIYEIKRKSRDMTM